MKRRFMCLTIGLSICGVFSISAAAWADLQTECVEVIDGEISGTFICSSKIADNTCTKGKTCGGLQNPGGIPCTISPTTGLPEGECINCSGTAAGDFCTLAKGLKCQPADSIFALPAVACGIESGANCIADPLNPFGAKCSNNVSTPVGRDDCQGLSQCY